MNPSYSPRNDPDPPEDAETNDNWLAMVDDTDVAEGEFVDRHAVALRAQCGQGARRRGAMRRGAGVLLAVAIVSVAACGGRASTTTAVVGTAGGASKVGAATPVRYRLLHAPIAVIEETSSGPAFQVRVRMSRRLPTDAQGVRMNVLVGASGSDAPPVPTDDRSRHCYAASIGNDINGGDPALEDAHQGTIVRVSIRIPGQRTLVHKVALRTRSGDVNPFDTLGCGRR